jgi:hypothetical protein
MYMYIHVSIRIYTYIYTYYNVVFRIRIVVLKSIAPLWPSLLSLSRSPARAHALSLSLARSLPL